MDKDCLWCWFYKRERDEARSELARLLTDEERLQITRLRTEIRRMQIAAEVRNRQLDAMHYVWCTGGCEGGVHRFDGKGPAGLTQEIVDEAIRNTERLKRRWANQRYREKQQG
jgi:hypothetical protein